MSRDVVKPCLADHRLPWLLVIVCMMILFLHLGRAAFFEPDEGRNAERAREILILDNWVIPHENFLPALDKPIAFYWLIAFAYKVFGVSEWSARLPSALAAAGCLVLVYGFVHNRRNPWESLGSVLVLATSVEFFLYARIVIFDMTLTFLTTLTLLEFYRAANAEDKKTRRRHCLLIYTAMGCATLIKGPIGALIPGMVMFFYLLVTHKWRLLAQMSLIVGALTFCVIVAPFYVWAEVRDPGYLRYFLWEENFLRFFTPHFQRSKPWYYYFLVIAAGFSPWSFFIPSIVKSFWKKKVGDRDLFLILWIALPLIFFSLSNSKLPHYILPIFPPLAILTAKVIGEIVNDNPAQSRWPLSLPVVVIVICSAYLIVGSLWVELLPQPIRHSANDVNLSIWAIGLLLVLVFSRFALGAFQGKWREQRFVYLCYSGASVLFACLVGQMSVAASYDRSAKPLANNSAPFIGPDHQTVFYDAYLTGIPFYLQVQQPIWIVWSGHENIIMDNIFVAQNQPAPAAHYGQTLFTYEQFDKEWKGSTRPLRVFIKKKHLARLALPNGTTPKVLATEDDFALVTNR
jgi:4-amino-4-deoxy-L-arabinose transferase-like glycosyltransferase